jgi:serine/threonine protein kinase
LVQVEWVKCRARDPRLRRDVAIKVSALQFGERFEREAQAIAALNHPNICQIYDVGPNYLVIELIEGVPLAGPLPLDQALKYATQICDALDVAHKKDITHRDLKPANILVTKAGIKLLDFGLAKLGGAKNGHFGWIVGHSENPRAAEGSVVASRRHVNNWRTRYCPPELE